MFRNQQSGQGVAAGVTVAAFIVAALTGIVFLFIWLQHRTEVKPGDVGVVDNWSYVDVNQQPLQNGIHQIGLGQEVHTVNIQPQKYDFHEESAGSDGQTIKVDVIVSYEVTSESAASIYVKGGVDHILQTVVNPTVTSDVKQVMGRYSIVAQVSGPGGVLVANEKYVVSHRGEVQTAAEGAITPFAKKYGITVLAISLANWSGDPKFQEAVEQTAIAQQHQAQATAEGQATIAKANADAQAQKALASAVTEATLKSKELDIQARQVEVQAEMVKAWDHHLPTYYSGNGSPFNILFPSSKPQ